MLRTFQMPLVYCFTGFYISYIYEAHLYFDKKIETVQHIMGYIPKHV